MVTRGERLHKAMEARGIRKQQALAYQLGVHDSAITRWKDNKAMSLGNAIALCDALDISLDWLLTGRGTIDSHKSIQKDSWPPDEEKLVTAFRRIQTRLSSQSRARLYSLFVSILDECSG